MKSTAAMFVAMLLCMSALAAEPPAESRPPRGKSAKGRPAVPVWHDRFDLPWEVAPADIEFKSAETKAALLKADAATRKLAADWKVQAGEAYRYLNWNSGSGGGYSRTYMGKWESGSVPRHTISLRTTLYEKSPPGGFELGAMWEPSNGWKSSLGFGPIEHGKKYQFNVALFHPTLTPKSKFGDANPGLKISPGGPYFSTVRRDGEFNARFKVSSSNSGFSGSSPEVIARYWKSPDSFRDVVLEQFDKFEDRARESILSEGRSSTLGGPTGGDPPMPAPRDEISEEVRKAALEEALAHIAAQKALVSEHYVEMHRATTSAFPPLLELVGEAK